ncbi:TPA: hypothetical protein SMQ15_002457 [Proteus mirabilis]|nr:Hypothetical protein [Providencia alcalifaciens]URQ57968.1 Hypothetical protein [Providencia rettgeri]HEK1035283.1 hypothetical protein [Proteus mirabilis]
MERRLVGVLFLYPLHLKREAKRRPFRPSEFRQRKQCRYNHQAIQPGSEGNTVGHGLRSAGFVK